MQWIVFHFFWSTLCNINSHWIIDKAFASYLNHSTYFVKVLTLNFFFRINISDAWTEGNPFCIGVNNLYQELLIRDCNERLPFLCYKEADILSFKPSRHLQIEWHKQCHLDFQKIKKKHQIILLHAFLIISGADHYQSERARTKIKPYFYLRSLFQRLRFKTSNIFL